MRVIAWGSDSSCRTDREEETAVECMKERMVPSWASHDEAGLKTEANPSACIMEVCPAREKLLKVVFSECSISGKSA